MAQEPNQMSGDAAAALPTAGHAPTPGEIRVQIEQTRAEMSGTLNAIQERLSPGRMMTDARRSVKDATVGRIKRLAAKANGTPGSDDARLSVDRVIHAVRAHPIPFALAAAAAAALVARAGSRPRMLIGAGAAGLACWSAWRANSRAAADQW